MATEFSSDIAEGAGFSNAVTHAFVANSTGIKLYGPVILVDPVGEQALPKVDSTTTAGNQAVIGVCVALPQDEILVAGESIVQVCVAGITKCKVNDATVAVGAALVTHTDAGEAAVRAAFVVGTTYTEANLVAALDGIRSCFAIDRKSVV